MVWLYSRALITMLREDNMLALAFFLGLLVAVGVVVYIYACLVYWILH